MTPSAKWRITPVAALLVSDAAAWLELRDGSHVVGRFPVRLDRGHVNIVR